MLEGLSKSLAKQVDRGKLEASDSEAILARVTATDHLGDLVDCDLVIESVAEEFDSMNSKSIPAMNCGSDQSHRRAGSSSTLACRPGCASLHCHVAHCVAPR